MAGVGGAWGGLSQQEAILLPIGDSLCEEEASQSEALRPQTCKQVPSCPCLWAPGPRPNVSGRLHFINMSHEVPAMPPFKTYVNWSFCPLRVKISFSNELETPSPEKDRWLQPFIHSIRGILATAVRPQVMESCSIPHRQGEGRECLQVSGLPTPPPASAAPAEGLPLGPRSSEPKVGAPCGRLNGPSGLCHS